MTHQQILEKAIQKAISAGWDMFGFMPLDETGKEWHVRDGSTVLEASYDAHKSAPLFSRVCYGTWQHERIVFNHDFAKSLWGDEEISLTDQNQVTHYASGWRKHLQQMVVADDPMEYLGERI